ncbi:5,10-methylenetetrahydrofolate reductase [Buchnera aphidicola (Diuraphis noxia)]|uniref:Methylenetetrahydrofolate reductase n=1 Tax=Buchnera aphidicola subsp. Diuraphis noxia TaxID=118101 RepID=A0A1B2H7U6_BUCDN|nr:methylenetetrahydrofolate reductase [Buchnera aphidicola]ANZ22297.1 5,10-methylenetetrahydrofolate reductase [Buchnera aphidicola (Diuraphis noxia)]
MYRISEYYKDIVQQKKENIRNFSKCSFEFYPPKNLILENTFWPTVEKLSKLKPNFFSVTYGANSGEREKTYHFAKTIYEQTGITTAAHLTCVNSTPDELKEIAKKYWENGIKSIVALRGDTLNKNNFEHKMYAVDLVLLLKKIANFNILVAGYPEMHPESKNSEFDIIHLRKKVDAGANKIITQFFFTIENYLRFRDNCIKNNINVEIIPGILPIYNFNQLQRFSSITNVKIPDWLFQIFNGLDNDLITQKNIGSSIVIDMVKILSREGVKNFHFYTLNQSDTVYTVCHVLGL